MAEQISLFASERESELEVVEMAFLSKRFTCVEELFQGFNHLYAITFSYGLEFIRKIVNYFDTAQIILGCEAMVKFDLQTIMAFQTRTLEELQKYDSLIERASNGTVTFWVAKEMLSHQKIFILTSDSGKTRVITGSANFSARSFSGDQRENIGYFENDAGAFNYYMDEFETLTQFSTNEVAKDALYINTKTDDATDIDVIPIIKEVKVKNAGIILEEPKETQDVVEFVYDINNLSAQYAKLVPKLDGTGGKILVTPKKVQELIRKNKVYTEELKAKRAKYPQFKIDYDEGQFSFNDKPYRFDHDMDQVKSDLIQINAYFEGFDIFIGNVEQMKQVYFRAMNYSFLSPFIANLRHEAYKTKFPAHLFPMLAVINGPKSAGKSAFMETVQHIMFGQSLGGVSPSAFTKSGIFGLLHESTGVPTHIEDIGRRRFSDHADEIVKYDEDILKKGLINHPVIIMTANDIESIKKEYAKRIYYASVDAQLNNVAAVSNHKKMIHFRKQITTSFYKEYLKRMYPKIIDLIETMRSFEYNKETGNWVPDIFHISSQTIIEIYHDCNLEIPAFITEVKYSDYFGHTDLTEKVRNKIIFEWEHNKKAFKVLRKKNLLEFTAGEKPYEATRIADALPEELRPKATGIKVVMLLDEAEKFFGIRFKSWGF